MNTEILIKGFFEVIVKQVSLSLSTLLLKNRTASIINEGVLYNEGDTVCIPVRGEEGKRRAIYRRYECSGTSIDFLKTLGTKSEELIEATTQALLASIVESLGNGIDPIFVFGRSPQPLSGTGALGLYANEGVTLRGILTYDPKTLQQVYIIDTLCAIALRMAPNESAGRGELEGSRVRGCV